jgi:hypothetical protein
MFDAEMAGGYKSLQSGLGARRWRRLRSMNFPKVIKSRDLPIFEKELELTGGRMVKIGRRKMFVQAGPNPDHVAMYKRTSKKWIYHYDWTEAVGKAARWWNNHTHATSNLIPVVVPTMPATVILKSTKVKAV